MCVSVVSGCCSIPVRVYPDTRGRREGSRELLDTIKEDPRIETSAIIEKEKNYQARNLPNGLWGVSSGLTEMIYAMCPG